MLSTLLENESTIRLTFFLSSIILMALWEVLLPKRQLLNPKPKRWIANIAIVTLDTAMVKLLINCAAFCMAIQASYNGWGFFNTTLYKNLNISGEWLPIVVSLLIFDLIIYLQHVAFHKVPSLWALHKMHHSDTDIDVTTAARFHPIEILISMGIKICLVLVLGSPAVAIVLFEIILNGMATFNHSNVKLPKVLDTLIRLVFVTPDVHRVHHSSLEEETNSNYGFNLTLWDKLFKTYTAQPKLGHLNMEIGLKEFRSPKENRLDKLLTQPFRENS
jgi:sterol desaturase/sphingolipid hydroxylase (fatty acid hydroxylase superfamily)